MTLQNDHDPGWWRRGMTKRAQIIVFSIAGVVIVGGIVFVIASGIPFF